MRGLNSIRAKVQPLLGSPGKTFAADLEKNIAVRTYQVD